MKQYIAMLKARKNPVQNAYLRALREGTFRRADFIETQIQFLFAVAHFSRPLLMLASRLPRPEMRISILEHVGDEHGHGNVSMSHEQTFLLLLDRLDVSMSEIEKRALWPEVRAFNIAMTGLCMTDDPFTALAALGMIENIFEELSEELGRLIIMRGWLSADQLTHYSMDGGDQHHADAFYGPLHEAYETDPRYTYQIQQGLELGAYLFLRLYDGLYRARGRRWTRDIGGPHSVADGWFLAGLLDGNELVEVDPSAG